VVSGGTVAAVKGTATVGSKIAQGARVADKTAEQGGLNLFKWGSETTTTANGWREGDYMLHLPDKGSPAANWAQNSGRLREAMGHGKPIFDSYRDVLTGEQIPTRGFLNAERNLLESHGWQYDFKSGAYNPPSP
jgi:hypothetical protein